MFLIFFYQIFNTIVYCFVFVKCQNEFVEAVTEFTVNMYRSVGLDNNDNLFISPIGNQMLLNLIFQGAKGITSDELRYALFYNNLKNDDANIKFKELYNRLDSPHSNYILHAANRLYFQKGLNLQENFLKLLTIFYEGKCTDIDFQDKMAAQDEINHWIEFQTSGKIKNIIKDLQDNTLLIITSVLYFKGNWAKQFEETNTKIGNFTTTNGHKNQIKMMTQSGYFKYAENIGDLNCKIVEVPYSGNELSLFMILPLNSNNLKNFEAKLNYRLLHSLEQNMTVEELNPLEIPKFKITKEYHLNSFLENLGIKSLFDSADLSGIFKNNTSIVLKDVIQKTFIEMNERGSEMAAAIKDEFEVRMIPLLKEPKKYFIANRPFIFFIRENISKIILFLGRITNI